MPSARDIKAGAAYVELTLKDGSLTKGLRRAQRRMQAFAGLIGDLGGRLTRLASVVSLPFIGGIKVYADFEQQLANVATMLERPEEQLPGFRQAIRDLAIEFGESTEALAGGLYDILSASIPTEQALEVLSVSARAAKAGLTDTATAADAITTVLNAYRLSADQAGSVSDLLFGIVKRGKTTFGRLAPTIGNIATLASSAGLSLEELGAGIALLTRNGIKTEEAITALSAIISTFLKPSAEGATLAESLGLSLSTATLQAEGLAGVLQKIQGLPPDALAQLFPNVRALKGVLPALQNIDGFSDDIAALQNRAGTTETAYAVMTRTLIQAFRQLRQAGLGVLNVMGEALAGSVGAIVGRLRQALTIIRQFIADNHDLVRSAAQVVVVVAAVGAALVSVGIAGQGLAFVFGGIATILTGVGTVFGLVGSVLGALLTPIGLITTAVVGMGAYLAASTGVGATALSWLGAQFSQLSQTATDAWTAISTAFAAGDIALAARVLWLTLKQEWQRGVGFLTRAWIQWKQFFLATATNAFYGVVALLVDAWAGLQTAWVETVDFLADAWSVFTSFLRSTWNSTQGWLAKRITELWGLFDEDLDVAGVQREIDADTNAKNTRIDGELADALNRRGDARAEQRATIARERDAMLTAIGQAANTESAAQDAQAQRDMMASELALGEARREWAEALDAARGLGGENDNDATNAGPEGTNTDSRDPAVREPAFLSDLQQQLQAATAGLNAAAARTTNVDVAGSFNATAVRGLGLGTSAQERTAMASEATARHTRDLARQAQDGGLTFG